MASAKLVFGPAADGNGRLVFGDQGAVVIPDADLSIDTDLPGLGELVALVGVNLSIDAELPGLDGEVALQWDANVSRVTRAALQTCWQQGQRLAGGVVSAWEQAQPKRSGAIARWQEARPLAAGTRAHWQESMRHRAQVRSHWQAAAGLRHALRSGWQETQRLRGASVVRWQEAAGLRHALRSGWQEVQRLRAVLQTGWDDGLRLRASLGLGFGVAVPVRVRLQAVWQEAMRPRSGVSPDPALPPSKDPCYDPATLGRLVFSELADGQGRLVFFCGRSGGDPDPGTVVVPVRKVYVTVNSITLRRVAGNVPLQAESFSMSIDVDSWTWNWSASLPASARQYLVPVDGLPVVVEATVNGVPYRLCAESMARSRTHGSARINVQGRGLGAVLDAPYSPALNFGNATTKTAQQLAADALTLNGVGIGWDVAWGLTDWQVPAGLWTHQGSYISAINAIATAAGGYVQPHATAQTLRILPRYPAMPWAWGALTPDYELPADVVEVEGVEWVSKPAYNWVHVAGVAGGVQVEAKRAGTAGDVDAPGITDPLITHVDAARQRAAAVLADTGPQATVSLRLPVLAATGLIQPGKFVRYLDGAVTRVGIVRGTALDWQRPTLRQTLTVETHGTD